MDSSCNPSYYKETNISESFTLVREIDCKSIQVDSISTTVYCYVSNDFNGDAVYLAVGSVAISENLLQGNLVIIIILKKREMEKT